MQTPESMFKTILARPTLQQIMSIGRPVVQLIDYEKGLGYGCVSSQPDVEGIVEEGMIDLPKLGEADHIESFLEEKAADTKISLSWLQFYARTAVHIRHSKRVAGPHGQSALEIMRGEYFAITNKLVVPSFNNTTYRFELSTPDKA